jgi:hypothetical protein
MPKRILDGDALWRSSKIRSLRPGVALHYANWIPMAAANGVFEADVALIHATIYAYIMPWITRDNVQEVLDSFIESGLVRIYHAEGKTWGYFTGIEKSGRLPELRYLSRYKNLPPPPPILDEIEENPD